VLPRVPWRMGEEPEALRRFLHRMDGPTADVNRAVWRIIKQVKAEGDAALLRLSAELDGVDLPPERLRVDRSELEALAAEVPPDTLAALEQLADSLRRVSERALPEGFSVDDGRGGRIQQRIQPLDSVGIYVPGGSASYPSAALMCAVPAAVAGVERLVAATPPQALEDSPALAAALMIAGVDEVYRVGGAQAIAALALGTATIPAVTKVVGPGNIYVAAAKRLCFGRVGIDAFAGPSELLVIADPETPAAWIAADLLAVAEHDADACVAAIVWSPPQAAAVQAALVAQLADLPRRDVAEQALARRGALFEVLGPAAACRLADLIAPQLVELLVEDPEPLAERIHHAAAVFLGRHTPQAVGDYAAGSTAVLPTSMTSRFSSGIDVTDFVRRVQWVDWSPARLHAGRDDAATLARSEGLEGHARSLEIRGHVLPED
jgi:histidinol dehydrogenase